MSHRTYRRADLVEARRRWAQGEFGPEWKPWYELAARRGFIFPPEGTKHDSWEDPQPSQRAIVYRAIEETPALLRRAIAASASWGAVVNRLIWELDRIREDAGLAERDVEWEREGRPSRREALETYAVIAARMAEAGR